MTVLVFLYHRTPNGSADDHFDVPLKQFRDQIERLIDSGVNFIRFRDAQDKERLSVGINVAITFDDGHSSNAEAFDYLAGKDIVPTAFIVRDWSEKNSAYLSPNAIATF